jgi:murein DD-endopeptidase MepM/ murein hydrolase activator NlpD
MRRLAQWLRTGQAQLAVVGAFALAVLIAASLDTDPAADAGAVDERAGAASGEDARLALDGTPPSGDRVESAADPGPVTGDAVDPGNDTGARPEPALERRVGPQRSWHYVQVASGDTMEIIFRRLGLSPRLLHDVVHLDERTASLVDLRPGDEIAFDLDDDDELLALRSEFDDEHWLFVERGDEGLTSRLEARNIDVRLAEVEAEITSSLFNAGKNAGLSDNMILRLAGIFGWDIDFALDIRRGDRFALVFEEIYRDGQFLRQGAIVAARFVNRGDSFEAVRFDAGDGPDYYAPDGRPMRKQFLRAPINFTRVSSNFNPRRLHPVTRRIRPHNGTDYAAPTGTPVWAAGDGTVIEAGYTRANGNYIFVKHGNHIVTRYLHLSRKHVSRGDRVRQGQTIGRVGATGLATGPHLHYEFLVHGRHRDPRTVDLPEAEPLPADVLPEFRAHAEPWLARLERLIQPDIMLAGRGGESGEAEDRNATSGASE